LDTNLNRVPARVGTVFAVLAAALTLVATAGAASPTAHSAKNCSHLPTYPGNGYFTSLSVTRVTCNTGKKVMKDHYRCRTRHGIRGKCGRVDGYSCTEKRDSISTEFVSKVTCKNGSRKVFYTYLQRT
jgi:hypothetical protein